MFRIFFGYTEIIRTIPREVRYFMRIKTSFSLSEKQKSVLIGTILGDGSLKIRGKHYRLHIKHSYNQRSLVVYKRKIFSNITNMPIRVFFQKVKNKDYKFCEFVTLTHTEFSKYREMFYKNGRKTITNVILKEFTDPLSLAIWFMDDGCAEYGGVSFNTQCFSLKEVGILVKMLKENFKIYSTVRKNKNGWIVYIPKNNLIIFKSMVEKYILPNFKYKLIPYSIKSLTP